MANSFTAALISTRNGPLPSPMQSVLVLVLGCPPWVASCSFSTCGPPKHFPPVLPLLKSLHIPAPYLGGLLSHVGLNDRLQPPLSQACCHRRHRHHHHLHRSRHRDRQWQYEVREVPNPRCQKWCEFWDKSSACAWFAGSLHTWSEEAAVRHGRAEGGLFNYCCAFVDLHWQVSAMQAATKSTTPRATRAPKLGRETRK